VVLLEQVQEERRETQERPQETEVDKVLQEDRKGNIVNGFCTVPLFLILKNPKIQLITGKQDMT